MNSQPTCPHGAHMGYLWAQWAIQGHGLSMGYNCGAHIGTMWVLHGQMFMGKNMGYNNGAHMGTLWVLYGQMVMGKYVGPTRATWTKSLWGPCGQPKRAPQLQPMVCPCGPHMGMLAGDQLIYKWKFQKVTCFLTQQQGACMVWIWIATENSLYGCAVLIN